MNVCCGTGTGCAVMGGLVGRAIRFNEKVIPRERNRPGCGLFAWLKFLLCNKSTRTYMSTCVWSGWVNRGNCGIKEMEQAEVIYGKLNEGSSIHCAHTQREVCDLFSKCTNDL